MSRGLICDHCKQPTDKFVVRLYIVPLNGTHRRRAEHSHYTGYADIGECCAQGVVRDFKFSTRRKRPKRVNA